MNETHRNPSQCHTDHFLLVVDDEPRFCDSLKVLLSTAGYRVDTALSGEEAISYFQDKSYHLALVDLDLPDLNGNDIARFVAEKHPDTVVIILTGRATVDTVIDALHHGVYDYLHKPYDSDHLLRIITNAIQHKQLEKELQLSVERLKFAMKIGHLGYWQWEKYSDTFFISDEVYPILDLNPATFKPGKKELLQLVHSDDRHRVALFHVRRETKDDAKAIEFQAHRTDGKLITIRAEYENLFDNSGTFIGKYGVYQDITDFKQAETELILSGEIIEHAMEGIYITNDKGIIQMVNPAAAKITGYTPDELIGQNPRIFKSDRHSLEFQKKMLSTLFQTGSWQGEIWTRRKNGEDYPQWLSITSLKKDDTHPSTFIAIFHDITEIKQREKEVLHQAHHDPLTKLPNRLLFFSRLKAGLQKNRQSQGQLAVLFIDLDNFKNINDSLSHAIGDQVLCMVAERIKKCTRARDTVSRHGGDEFAVLLDDLHDIQPAIDMAMRINKIFRKPFMVEGNECFITASIGVTFSPQDGDNENVLIKNADLAMYQAKAEGKNTFCLYTDDINAKVKRRLSLINRLRNAIKNDEISVYYQPKVSIKKQCIVGVEALLRWEPESGEIISPQECILLAEETGMIVDVGLFVLKTACKQAAEWKKQGLSLSVAVNLSPRQFHQKDFLDSITNVLCESGLPANLLELEITESLMMENRDVVIVLLWEFKKLGIKISIDDFGTGYSSLAYLKQLPLDVLKIDRSFVKDLPENKDDAALTSTIISMADNFGLEVVAEGVETIEQYLFMQECGCQMIQGFLISSPEPPEQLMKLFRSSPRFSIYEDQEVIKYHLPLTNQPNIF